MEKNGKRIKGWRSEKQVGFTSVKGNKAIIDEKKKVKRLVTSADKAEFCASFLFFSTLSISVPTNFFSARVHYFSPIFVKIFRIALFFIRM